MTKKTAKIDKRFSRWIKIYIEMLHDPKILSLSEKDRWSWVCILVVAGKSDTGALPSIPHLAMELRMSCEDTRGLLDRLIESRLIDLCGGTPGHPTAYRPHNWAMRQYRGKSSTDRVREFRLKRKNNAKQNLETKYGYETTGNADETLHVTKNGTKSSKSILPKHTQKVACQERKSGDEVAS